MEFLYRFFYEICGVSYANYPPIQLSFLAFGFIFWAMAYWEVLVGTHKYKIVEIPIIVCAMDLTWEFCYGFILPNDFGVLFKYGCIAWFFLDLHINYHAVKYGKKLVTNDWIKANYIPIYLFILVGSGLITYYMKVLAVDDGLGLVSAYFINLVISSTYLYQLLNYPELREKGFRYRVAWAKFLGTGSITVTCFLHLPDNHFLHTMCIMVFVMDVLYIYLFKTYKPATT
jgi:hypothetical protein